MKKLIKFIENPWIVGLGVTIIGGLILYYGFGVGKTSTSPPPISTKSFKEIPSTTPEINLPDTLRALAPLETNKDISELPDGIFGYAYAFEITRFIQKNSNGLNLTNHSNNYKFEIQKSNNNVSIIGYIDEVTFSKLGSIDKTNQLNLLLFPINWKGDKYLIQIPINSLLGTTDREIDIDELTRMSILETTVTSVNSDQGIKSHRSD